MLTPHGPEWYDRLARLQRGYFYPWKSVLPPFNGEDVYRHLLHRHLTPDTDVLDVACGHGVVALEIAPLCRHVVGYDRVPSYIQLAREAASTRGIENAAFICADSSVECNGGRVRIPAEPQSFDLLTSRRGPLHWIDDAPRVGRAGAIVLQLNPMDVPPPRWNNELPEPLRLPVSPVSYLERSQIRRSVEERLAGAGLRLDSCWTFEVPEVFPDPEQFYIWRSWGFAPGEVPPFEQVRAQLTAVFQRHVGETGLAVPFGRFLWKAIMATH